MLQCIHVMREPCLQFSCQGSGVARTSFAHPALVFRGEAQFCCLGLKCVAKLWLGADAPFNVLFEHINFSQWVNETVAD